MIAVRGIAQFGLSLLVVASGLRAADRTENISAYKHLPLHFEAAPNGAGFVARGAGLLVRVRADSAEFGPVSMRLLGARPDAGGAGLDPLPGTSNYFLGDDARNWRSAVTNYGQARFASVYPGIDVVYHGRDGRLEYDFLVAPNADPDAIRMRFDGASVSVDRDGNLIAGQLRLNKPVAYQDGRPIQVSFARRGGAIGFHIGRYDRSRPLVIDPTLVFSTFLGGSLPDNGLAVALDSAGNVYVAGLAESADFPVVNPVQPTCKLNSNNMCYVGFISKFNAAGTALIFSTYFGGSLSTFINGLAVDPAGNVYAAGYTGSTDFPLLNPIQSSRRASTTGFVSKLSPAGALVYSTYLGGSTFDQIFGVAVDSAGSTYVAGLTTSTDFPVVNAFQSKPGGQGDAFVAKLNPAGSALVYSTFLGGSGGDQASGIAVDSAGNAFVTGTTSSKDFPLMNALQTRVAQIFVSKFNAAGSLAYSTYFGGTGQDQTYGLALDGSGSIYIAGRTNSSDFPVAGALQPKYGGGVDGFVTKLNAAGSAIVYSTFLGGSGGDEILAIAVDAAGNVAVTGDTHSTDFPLANALQPAFSDPAGQQSGFVAKIAADGSRLIYSTYLGSTFGTDQGSSVAIDAAGAVYVVGDGGNPDFPTINALYPNPSNNEHVFLLKMTDGTPATCVYANSVASYTAPGAGISSVVRVSTNSNICAWTATSGAPWVTITQGSSLSGIGTVFFTVAPNTTLAARSTTLTVAGRSIPISQTIASHVAADAAAGAPGGVARVPLTLVSDVPYPLNTITVTVTAGPIGAAPALTNGIGFQPDPGLAAPTSIVAAGSIGTVKFTWTLLHPAPTGTFKLGELLVPIPATASLGQSYSVQASFGSSIYKTPDTPQAGSATFTDTFIPGAAATVTVSNPVPLAVWMSPSSAAPGSAAIIAIVNGEGFTTASTVMWNGSARATTLINETQLQFTATSADLAANGTAQVTVSNGSPGGGVSKPLPFVIASVVAPAISNGGVVSAASYFNPLAGGMIASLFGVKLAPGTILASSTPLPTALNGTSVLVDGVPAPLIFVSASQINFQLPWRLLGQTQSQIAVASNGATSNIQTISLSPAAPAIFTMNQQGTGQGAIIANGSTTYMAPLNSIPGVQTRPAIISEAISIYCTGLGVVDRAYADGVPAVIPPQPGIPPSNNPPPDLANSATPQVTVGGVPVANIYFSGLAPGYVGLYQITVALGNSTPIGDAIPVVVTLNGVSSKPVTIAVQAKP